VMFLVCNCVYLAVFPGQVLSFQGFLCFPVPEPSNEVGDVFICIGVFFASNFHMAMGKSIG